MIRAMLKAMLVLCLVSSLIACSETTPDRPDRGQTDPAPQTTPKAVVAPEPATRGSEASGPAGRTVVEHTMGDVTLREDESVLRIDEAELLRSKEGDEIFVRATIEGPGETEDCFLMKGKTWFDLRDAIESEDVSEAPKMLETFWADALSTERFSSGDTYAVSFRQDPDQNDEVPNPEDTPYFALCYKISSVPKNGPRATTWYAVSHVRGTPKAS